MAEGIAIRIEGIEKLKRALDGDLRKALREITFGGAQQVKQFIAPYPLLSEANQPDHRWYQRGYGPRWRRKDGSIGGSKTSEIMKNAWGIRSRGTSAEVGNEATYSPVVHHHEEQASFHKRRGWVTDEQAVAKLVKSGALDRIVQIAVKKAMR